ncbi:MAG: phage tail protein [Clostridiales bacterium]|nr:phage tail protein [Clostridiales bacterium]
MGYKKGQKIKLKNAASYESSTTSKISKRRTGTYYIWSAATRNGRIRITTKKSYAGKTPASKYVTCWVKTSAVKSTSTSSTGSTKSSSSSSSSSTTTTKTTTSTTSSTTTSTSTTVVNVVEATDVTPTTTLTGQIGYLGLVVFAVSASMVKTLDDFTLTSSVSYVQHDRHLTTPRLEFTGIDASTITFTLILSAYLGADVWSDYNKLETYMDKGIAVPLKIGDKTYGNYRWCIEKLVLKGSTTDGDGNWTSAEVSVSLISIEKKG